MYNAFGVFILVIAGAASRIIPHPPNVTAVAAMALVGGMYLNKNVALFLPLGAMVLSDIVIGFHGLAGYVYGGFLLTSLAGIALKDSPRMASLACGSIAASILFFVVTNAGVWLLGDGITYPKTLEGLLACYAAGIPFFKNSLLGDLIYTGILAGVFEIALRFGMQKSAANPGP